MIRILGILMMVLAFTVPQSFADDRPLAAPGYQMMQEDPEDSEGGIPVQNQNGQEIGRVVALATTDTEIAYFLVAMNGSEGELKPVPFSAALFDPQVNAVILLGVDDSELAQAPTISIDEVQRLADPEFERRVHSYYEQEPAQQEESL